MDLRQIRALTVYTLKSEWRQASQRMNRGRRKTSRWWAYGQALIYIATGAATIRLFQHAETPAGFFGAASILFFYVASITASNIFLSFSTGFLSPDELSIVSPLPVESQTFFFSRLTVLIFYSTIVTLLFIVVPVGWIVYMHPNAVLAAIGLTVSAVLSNVSASLAVIVLYGILLRRLSKAALARMIGYAQFAGSMLIAVGWVLIPRLNVTALEYTPLVKPYLSAIPAFWFGALATLIGGQSVPGVMQFAIAAISFVVLLSVGAHVLLGKHYQSEVGELAGSTMAIAKDHSKKGMLFGLYYRFARTHEARAVFTIIRAQFRFDTKFRVSLLAVLPMPFIYLALALLQGSFQDPFGGSLKGIAGSQMIYFFAMLMPMMLMQNMMMTENYKAAWIFFALPAERSRLLLAVRNSILISFIIPYLVLLCFVFSYFMPPIHAIKHVIVLGAIGNFVFQGYLWGQARMPFAQQRRPNQRGVAQFAGMFIFMILPMGLLALDMYYGYKTELSYWSGLAFILTLSVIAERFMQSRIRVRLEREEFAG